jgi:serine/threonine-protein kinase
MNRKTNLILLVSICALCTVFSGCGNNTAQTTQTTTGSQTQTTAATTAASTTKANSTMATASAPTEASATTAAASLQYANERYGFSIDYPNTFTEQTKSDNGDGIILSTKDGSAVLTVSGSNNALGDSAAAVYANMLTEHSNASEKAQKDNWAAISWVDGDNTFYEKSVIGSGSINTFVLQYPTSQKDVYSSIITLLDSSFKTPTIEESH